MIQETSRKAYERIIPKLGDRQKTVYLAFKIWGDMSNSEIANKLGCPINCITPRTNELVKMKLLEIKDKRKCNITNRLVLVWGIARPVDEINHHSQMEMF